MYRLRPLLFVALALCSMLTGAFLAIGGLLASLVPRPVFAGHLHLMPGTPRSIVDTRRMGLA